MSITDKLTLIAENEQKVYEAGQEYQKKHFFQIFQKNGTRTDYNNAFYGEGWNDETYNPLYPIVSTSQATQTGIFYSSEITDTKVPITVQGKIQTLFGASKIKIIRKLIFDGVTSITNIFNLCADLEELNVEGIIEVDGVNLRWSKKLTYDSCHSIFTHLKDFRVPTIISTNVTNTQTPTVIGKGTLTAGKQYTWRYYMSLYPGWMVDDSTKNPINDPEKELTFEETSITSVAQEIAINGNNYIGFKAECRNFPGDTDGGYFIYIYQDGENIMVYSDIGGITSIDTIELTLLIAEETRTITMPKAVKDNGNATPEDIAEAEAKGWEITWAE